MKTPQHLPLPMERYGLKNGHAAFRVVWSDSRTYLVGNDEGFKELPLYDFHAWVLEKYLTAEEFAGSKKSWDLKEMGGARLGPYPSQGEWEFCYQFPFTPTDSMIDVWVRANGASIALTPQQRKDSIMQPMLDRKARNHKRVDDVFDEAMHGFRNGRSRLVGPGHEPIHLKRTKRRDDMKLKLSAEDLGMPLDDNSFFTGGRNATERTGRSQSS
jgi:hypothetical protein